MDTDQRFDLIKVLFSAASGFKTRLPEQKLDASLIPVSNFCPFNSKFLFCLRIIVFKFVLKN